MANMAVAVLAEHLPRTPVPHLHCLVVAGAHETPAARIERERTYELVVPDNRAQARARRRLPDLDLAVVRARDNIVVPELDAREPAVVPVEHVDQLLRPDIPQHHLPVPARARDPAALEPNGVYGALVPAERAVQLQRAAVPDANERVLRAAM